MGFNSGFKGLSETHRDGSNQNEKNNSLLQNGSPAKGPCLPWARTRSELSFLPGHAGCKSLTPQAQPFFRSLLAVAHLVTRFPAFYGTRWLITMFTTPSHLTPPRATWIQSTSSHLIYKTRFNISVPFTVWSRKWLISFTLYAFLTPTPPAVHAPVISSSLNLT